MTSQMRTDRSSWMTRQPSSKTSTSKTDKNCLWRVSQLSSVGRFTVWANCPPNGSHNSHHCLTPPSVSTARNKDNSWPEEMIAIVKEVQARDKDREKNKIQQGSINSQLLQSYYSCAIWVPYTLSVALATDTHDTYTSCFSSSKLGC